jgi:amphi-Trp domain-containing protein
VAKTKRVVTRNELVSFLEGALTDIREGKLAVEGTTVNLPEQAVLEVETEEKAGTMKKIELEIEWSFAGVPEAPKAREEEAGQEDGTAG